LGSRVHARRTRPQAACSVFVSRHAGSSIPTRLPGYTPSHLTQVRVDRRWRCYDSLRTLNEERTMTRDRLLEDLRWLADGNPKYAGTSEEGEQNAVVAHLMADDLLLSYIDDREVTELFNRIRKGYPS
jgi:hypothetical protein